MPLPTLPEQPAVDPAGDYARAQAWAMLLAKYEGSGNWAAWAAQMLESDIADITNKLGADTVGTYLNDLLALIDSIPTHTVGDVTYTDDGFTSPLLTALQNRISADLATSSTGLGAAETALFARETARVTAERAAAYTEITTKLSSGEWDMPPGALLAKQTEMNNETSKRLTDSSAQIMAESARLAVDYNKAVLTSATQIVDLLGRLYDSKVMRDFEASKLTVTIGLENYKSLLGFWQLKGEMLSDVAKVQIEAAARQMQLEISTLQGLAQAASQMVASALGSVSSSTSFGFGGSASTHYDGDITEKTAANLAIAGLQQSPGGY